MTTDMTKCHVAKSGNIMTAKGRLSYAQYLIDPQENKKSGKMKYGVNIVFPENTDFTELRKAMGKIALNEVSGDKARAKKLVEKRFLDPNDLPQGGKPMGDEFEGWTLIRGTSDYAPKFAYPNGKEIPAEEIRNQLYSGRWGRVTFNPYWSSNSENPGVCLGLQNVQLLDHDENLGVAIVSAEDEFESVEGVEDTSDASEDASGDVDSMFG